MKKIISLSLVATLLALSAVNVSSQTEGNVSTASPEISKVPTTEEARSFGEYTAVARALQPYIDGAKRGDGKLIRTAFYDHAYIVGSVGGKFTSANLDAFEKGVNSVGAAPDIEHRIVSIDVSGPAASAKVEFKNWAGFRFTDFFVLYKHAGKWKISSKVYDAHSNN